MKASALIQVQNLKKSFDQRGINALNQLSFQLDHPGLYFLMGPSGHGKSTLLKVISGEIRSDSGQVLFSPKMSPLTGNTQSTLQLDLRSHEWQQTNLQHFLGQLVPHHQDPVEVARAMALDLNLEKHLRKNLRELSQGQLTRAWLGRTMGAGSPLILLDEPFQHLDPILMREIVELLQRLAQQKNLVILLATHDRELALAYATEILFLNHGSLIQQAVPEEIFLRPRKQVVAEFWGPTNCILAFRQNGSWTTALGPLRNLVIPNNQQARALLHVPAQNINVDHEGRCLGLISEKLFTGNGWMLTIQISGLTSPLFVHSHENFMNNLKLGEQIKLRIEDKNYHQFDDIT